MTGLDRHIKLGLAVTLFASLATGCAYNYPYAQRVPEEIPAQVCTGNGDSDMDGVTDCYDRCPQTPRSSQVDADGCPLPEDMPPKPYRG
jgi:hypothetical protein